MNEKIKKVLDNLKIESFYLTRKNYKGECVVYNYISNPLYYADNEEKAREYTILLNVYSKEKIDFKNEKIRKAMLNAGFRGGRVQVPIQVENGFFNTAISFKGYLRS